MRAATRHWTRLADGRLRCDVCPRRCALREGQAGFCFVRSARDGGIALDAWGRTGGFCVDPIEKKPLYHFLPGSTALSFGTVGCNLGCRYCQNWSLSRSRELPVLGRDAFPGAVARAAEAQGCRSVAFTYNDPVVFLEYAVDVARACRSRGVRTAAVTAGYVEPAARAELFAEVDAANVDLKAFDEQFYRRFVGGQLEPVLDTLRWLVHETAVWVEITTLLVPGLNDSDAELKALAGWVAGELGVDVPLHFSAFHPDWRLLDRPPTPPATLGRARGIALEAGLRHVYTGNLRDRAGGRTCCHACGELLLARDGFRLEANCLEAGGRCPACGTRCAGVFENCAGDGP